MTARLIHLNPPLACDMCSNLIEETFFDAKTIYGPWANLCSDCFDLYTERKLGTGNGQKYVKTKEGSYVKSDRH